LHHNGLRIITNNLNVAAILCENRSSEVIVAGGVVRSVDRAIIGEATIDFVRQFRVDVGIIGISGIDNDGTLLDFDYREVRVAQAIIENSRQVFLVADHSKFERRPMVRLGHLSQLTAVFTDKMPSTAIRDLLAQHEIQLHVAPQE
jgi:DeoR family glycerol-3-phosphate regulon repressor